MWRLERCSELATFLTVEVKNWVSNELSWHHSGFVDHCEREQNTALLKYQKHELNQPVKVIW